MSMGNDDHRPLSGSCAWWPPKLHLKKNIVQQPNLLYKSYIFLLVYLLLNDRTKTKIFDGSAILTRVLSMLCSYRFHAMLLSI